MLFSMGFLFSALLFVNVLAVIFTNNLFTKKQFAVGAKSIIAAFGIVTAVLFYSFTPHITPK